MQKRRRALQRKSILLVAFVGLFTSVAVAVQDDAAEADGAYQRLYEFLAGYLARDLELQRLTLTAQSKQLALDASKISNGIALSLSTGTITVRSTGDGMRVSFEPQATLSLPLQNDTTVSADVPVTVVQGERSLSNAKLSVTTGIITGAVKSKRLAVLQAERAALEAERAAQDRALNAEKAFYSELKTLYGYAITAITERNDLLNASDSFRTLVIKEYSKESAQYRQSFLNLQGAVYDAVQAQRDLERGAANLARKCGISYPQPLTTETSTFDEIDLAFRAAMDFLPFAVPEVDGIDVLSFPETAYTATESALWEKQLAELKRDADYALTLKATGTYTFNDSSVNSDTVGAGLSLDWNGLTATAGVAVPTGAKLLDSSDASQEKQPVYTLSLGWTPNTRKQARISREQDAIDEQLEDIAIQSAADNYKTAVFDKQANLRDLQWSRHFYSEQLDMYTQLERDMKQWLDEGIVTRAAYFDTRNNRDKAQLNLLINAANFIIYNNETTLLFRIDSVQGVSDDNK